LPPQVRVECPLRGAGDQGERPGERLGVAAASNGQPADAEGNGVLGIEGQDALSPADRRKESLLVPPYAS
jgi:hypothetical protein